MHEIEMLWPADRLAEIKSMIEAATGAPCPCTQGAYCPVLGDGKAIERFAEWEGQQSVIRPPIRAIRQAG